jgi:hypothetical protein
MINISKFYQGLSPSKHSQLVKTRLSRNPGKGEGMARKWAETPQNGGRGGKGREKDHWVSARTLRLLFFRLFRSINSLITYSHIMNA